MRVPMPYQLLKQVKKHAIIYICNVEIKSVRNICYSRTSVKKGVCSYPEGCCDLLSSALSRERVVTRIV